MTDRNRDWSVDDISWQAFAGAAVDPDILKVVKAAALVEYNGADYARYLCEVFRDDEGFCAAAARWGAEEQRHGAALRRWTERADPGFDFDAAFARFAAAVTLPRDADGSVRGTRCGELVARCMVEVGTSSFYAALGDASAEPVLREICRRIAADEVRHYKLFLTTLDRYQAIERIGFVRRAMVALARILETKDDELAFAYYTANAPNLSGGDAEAHGDVIAYDRRTAARAYAGRAFSLYQPRHVRRGLAMFLKTVGFERGGATWVLRWLAAAIHRIVVWRARRLAALQ
ncbi:MAG: ferritin-like domain-containing protein [Alphaproteobacteria bacterium]|nr:ferritin-like domain-containing protein [Alphaproteobacteria bacterium]